MTKKYLLIALLVACFSGLFVVVNTQQTPKSQVVAQTQSQYISEDELWTEVNNWRKLRNYKTYQRDEQLCEYAEVRASEIKTEFNHDIFIERFKNHPFEISENMVDSTIDNDVHTAMYSWLKSTDHREALERNYTHSCIKCNDGYCVQLFSSY